MRSSLQQLMASHGFESNDDYEFQVRCLLDTPFAGIRALNIEGDSGRGRTAFATALARSLEYPHLLYHDFTQRHPPQPDVILPPSRDELGRQEPPIDPFDQVMSEACAFSEGENTILILDQLQAADFREHIRLYHFLQRGTWEFRDTAYYANPRFLLAFLISETPLYHSLHKASYRIWVNRVSHRQIPYRPEEFGLGPEAEAILAGLANLFEALDTAPTRSEYERLLHNIAHHARTIDHIRHAVYAWTDGADRAMLFSAELKPLLERVVDAIPALVGFDEVELISLSD